MRYLLASIVLLGAPLGTAQSSASSAADPSLPIGFGSWQEVGLAQLPLVKAADEISVVLGMMPTRAGFSALEIDLSSVFVYWKASEQVAAPVVGAVDSIRARGVTVQFREAPFSLDELNAESARVRSEAGSTFVSTSHLPHGAGLHIKVNSPGDLSTIPFVIASRSRLAELARGARAPSDVVVSKGAPPAEFSRGNDSSPYYSGAQVRGGSAGLCSSGFSVYNGGYRYMLSAGHCTGFQNDVYLQNGSYVPMGQSKYAAQQPFDTALVSVPNNSAYMYSGGVGSGEFTIHVVGQTSAYFGLYVYTSGGASGLHCGVDIDSTTLEWNDWFGKHHGPLIHAKRATHEVAAGHGDSGGPIYLPSGSVAYAVGVITGGDDLFSPATCSGIATDCSWDVHGPSIANALWAENVYLLAP